MHFALAAAYFGVLLALAMYGLHRSHLVFTVLRHGRTLRAMRAKLRAIELEGIERRQDLPCVTIQLPLYNEATVAARLLDHVAAIEWPRSRLEIQVLDDSTDETRVLAKSKVGVASRTGARRRLHPPRRSQRVQGRRARQRFEGGQGEARRHLRRGLPASARFPARRRSALHRRSPRRHGAGPLGTHQPRSLAAHAHAGADARRAPSRRKPGARGRGLAIQLLRYRRDVASGGHRERRGLATRHPHRRLRSVVSRAARGLEIRLPGRRSDAGGAP